MADSVEDPANAEGYIEVSTAEGSYTYGGRVLDVRIDGDTVTTVFEKLEAGVAVRSAPLPMKVVVAAVPGVPMVVAHSALEMEGVEHTVELMSSETSYAALLTSLWREGETFTLVEHDIAPFPGALRAMNDCYSWWCARSYHLAPHKLRPAFGCVRFHAQLMRAYPELWKRWDGEHWMTLDATVYRVLQETTRLHVHEPGVAHVKQLVSPLKGVMA